MMKRSAVKSLLLISLLAGFSAVQAQQSVSVLPEPSGKTDWAGAEKIFSEKDGKYVFTLTPLTPAQLDAVRRLPDMNRFKSFSAKKVESEYRYTLDSAAEQAEKETEKMLAHETDLKSSASGQAGTSMFYTVINPGGITFVFRNSSDQPGRYEIMLTPQETGRFGTQGIHLTLTQDAVLELKGWQYISSDRTQANMNGSRIHMRNIYPLASGKTDDGGILTRITIPWENIFRLTGDVPMRSERSALWNLSVFRWSENGSATLSGLPYENTGTCLVFPPFKPKQESGVKSGILNRAVSGFYGINTKLGTHYANHYLKYLLQQKNALPFYKERFYVKWRYGYPMTFAEYYLTGHPRRIAKEIPGDPEKTAEENSRIMEWEEGMVLRGNFIRTQAENQAIADELLRLEYERFAYPVLGFEELQQEAIGGRVFSDKFLEEE